MWIQLNKSQLATPALGALEIAVLHEIWRSGAPVDARQVLDSLEARRISLSTVQATLERLHRKKLLAREKVGRAYRYSAAVSQPRLIGTLIRELTEQLANGALEPVISGFVELVGNEQPELLERVQTEAAEHRRKEGLALEVDNADSALRARVPSANESP